MPVQTATITYPERDDVLVRSAVYRNAVTFTVGTVRSPRQLTVRQQDDAIAQAIECARECRVRAWIEVDADLSLLRSFRTGEAE